jgi:O-antigen/teichoic acid export membrane protein
VWQRVIQRFQPLVYRILPLRHELAWVVFGQALAFLGGFAAIKILTNVMGPEGYGQLALGITIAGLINMFVYGPLGQVVLRFFSTYRERGELDVYFHVLKKTHVVSGLILAGGVAIASAPVFWWFGADWVVLVVLASFFGIVTGFYSSFLFLQGTLRQRKMVALHQAAEAWLRPALGVAAFYVFSRGAPPAFLGFIVGTLMVVLSQWVISLRSGIISRHWSAPIPEKVARHKATKEFLAYAGPLSKLAVFSAISIYADRWVLQGMFGENQVGIYVALYQIANAPIALLFNSVTRFMEPIIFARAGTMTSTMQAVTANRLLYKVIAAFSFLMIPIVIAAYYFAEPLVRTLTSAAFSGYAGVLWIMTVGIALLYIGQLLTTKGMNFHRPGIYILPKAVQAGVFLILIYFLAKYFGLAGVAVSICISSLLYIVMVIIVNQRLEDTANLA